MRPEAAAAVPAAAVVATGALSPAEAWSQTRALLPAVGFPAAVLMPAQPCADEERSRTPADLLAVAAGGLTFTRFAALTGPARAVAFTLAVLAAALAGALVLGVRALGQRRTTAAGPVGATSPTSVPTSVHWRPCSGGACCATTAPTRPSATSPASGCSPHPPPRSPPPWRCWWTLTAVGG
ncbi:hypothetical protein [Saccharothrix sp. ST-888]|uniref:hypothetical protein n=1 Tax=Saccharothrix sp. ST-888 TaxID=1427391 RepID=UPI0005EC99EA|nr:hypothetical protein [Saccharothrix sp. ST-888]KJK59919.1 hypothetical protein UK12_00050 [Saccharothrix sp. ST-888]